ncbi:MAG TPA: TonB family protein [Thermoanaerobaculia bacterium]|nr:TonB family protein [Thermoanaerobaculia bacterium]
MEPELQFVSREPKKSDASAWVLVSLLAHASILLLLGGRDRGVPAAQEAPLAYYVELLRQSPFEEAPGPAVEKAPLSAPFSNENRRASIPQPTGDQPTRRPGTGGTYIPGGAPAAQPPARQAERAVRGERGSAAEGTAKSSPEQHDPFTFRQPLDEHPVARADAARTDVDWKSAIREVGRVASLGVGGPDLGPGAIGGEEGFAESGPISFETQWYEWGDYADAMVRKIRTHWYANMPSVIRLGLRGVVTIRFTIQRSGTITDIRILKSSEIPPFDFAAKKAIELASPLAPLPADFPNATEQVTAQFYYNLTPPRR